MQEHEPWPQFPISPFPHNRMEKLALQGQEEPKITLEIIVLI